MIVVIKQVKGQEIENGTVNTKYNHENYGSYSYSISLAA